jgi:hypothetical protein
MSKNEMLAISFDKAKTLSKVELRHWIKSLEDYMAKLPQLEIPVRHFYAHKVYGREILIEKGSVIIGKIHKHQTMNVISSGEVSVLSVDGYIKVKAPFTFISSPGAKRVIFAHEDTIWTTFHGTAETNLTVIEHEFIAKDYSEVEEKICLG